METIRITKEYTYEEIREDLASRLELAQDASAEITEALATIANSLSLKALNLTNVKENVHVLRREAYMLDQMLEAATSIIDAVIQASEPQAPPVVPSAPEGKEDV